MEIFSDQSMELSQLNIAPKVIKPLENLQLFKIENKEMGT